MMSIKLCFLSTAFLLLLSLGCSMVWAGEVAPEKQAEYQEIEKLIERLEEYFYGNLAAQDGALYTYTDDFGQKKKMEIDYLFQDYVIPRFYLSEDERSYSWEQPFQGITEEEVAAVVNKAVWQKYLTLKKQAQENLAYTALQEEQQQSWLAVQGLYRLQKMQDFMKIIRFPTYSVEAAPFDDLATQEEQQAAKDNYRAAIWSLQNFAWREAEDLAKQGFWAQALTKIEQRQKEMRATLSDVYQAALDLFADDTWQREYIYSFTIRAEDLLDESIHPTATLVRWQFRQARIKLMQQRQAQADAIKELLLQDIKKIQQKLRQIVLAQDHGDNHQAVAHLLEQFYEVDRHNFSLIGSALPGEGHNNAINVWRNQRLKLSRGLVLNYPRAVVRLVLAHELGHSLGLGPFVGCAPPCDFVRKDQPAVTPTEEQIAEYQEILARKKACAPFTAEQHPFKEVFVDYIKYGLNGLDYFDPAKTAAVKEKAQDVFRQLKEKQDYTIAYLGPHFRHAWQEADFGRAKAFDDLYWSDFLEKFNQWVLGAEGPLEEYANRAEEVLADHFAKLYLEDEIQAAQDPAEKKRLALEGVLKTMGSPTLDTALKYAEQYPGIVTPRYAQFQKVKQDYPTEFAEVEIKSSDLKFDNHPSSRERLIIILSSPTIRDALKDL